uniref:Uncharacterized protein n=1 Tax=Molossus molossus TaxID=27622 RepID=A0A7J8I143_MOLMO|nr:hypothetical protein HJG59_010872 [Molossus molossus]
MKDLGFTCPLKKYINLSTKHTSASASVSSDCYNKIPLTRPAAVAQWLSINPCTKRSPVRLPDKAHAQVVGLMPSRGHAGDSQSMFSLISVFIPLSLSLPLSLKSTTKKIFKIPLSSLINKYICCHSSGGWVFQDQGASKFDFWRQLSF